MLRDPRSKALTENFAAQWLRVRKLRDVMPDKEEQFPRSTTGSTCPDMRRDRALFQRDRPGRPLDPRLPRRGLHVRQRPPGDPLRHGRSLQEGLPPRLALGRPSRRAADAGQHPDRHVDPDPVVPREAWQVGARAVPRRAAPAPSALRAGPEGREGPDTCRLPPTEDGAAPEANPNCDLPCQDGPHRLRPGELRRHRCLARGRRIPDRFPQASSPAARRSGGRASFARS